jgi:hypothetical protein
MIKRGFMEVADVVVINKADGPTQVAARRAAAEFKSGLSLMKRRLASWQPQVLAASAHTGHNLGQLTKAVQAFVGALGRSGELQRQRSKQLQRVVALNMQVCFRGAAVLRCCGAGCAAGCAAAGVGAVLCCCGAIYGRAELPLCDAYVAEAGSLCPLPAPSGPPRQLAGALRCAALLEPSLTAQTCGMAASMVPWITSVKLLPCCCLPPLQDLLLERLRQDKASHQLLVQRLMPLILAGKLAPRTGAEWALSCFLEYASG